MKTGFHKYVIIMPLIATAVLAAPAGHADPDPHKPDLGANFCPGGATPPPDATCDGVPYDDGSYWHATQRGTLSNSIIDPPIDVVAGAVAAPAKLKFP